MTKMKDQILGGTRLDRQGEKLPKSFFEEFCRSNKNRRIVMFPEHDVSRQPVGSIVNFRLVPSIIEVGEWDLIGDVEFLEGCQAEVYGGFSVSGFISIRKSQNERFRLMLPISGYSDNKLVEELVKDQELTLDKWVKKGEAEKLALISTMVVIVLGPVWRDFYSRVISPRLRNFLVTHWAKLKKKDISLEFLQIVELNGHDVQLRFSGVKGNELECFSSESIMQGTEVAANFLDKQAHQIERIFLVYELSTEAYFIHWFELESGDKIHILPKLAD